MMTAISRLGTAARGPTLKHALALLLVPLMLAHAACLDSAEPETPRGTGIVGELRENAEEFEYVIGKQGGAFTFATISDPLTFNLAIATDASSSGVLGYLFEGLTETSWLTDEVEPALAESWERSEDGLTWTFRLRRDVEWHDGERFTAHDVDFTFNRIIYNHDIPASSRPSFHFRFLDDESGEWEEAPMAACSDSAEPETPRGSGIVGELRKNAEEFEYVIGKQGGAFTFATISDPLTFNLAIATDASSSGVLGYLFEGLTETSWLTDEVEPALAESWERSEDGLTWTFRLRRDVEWHDGERFTAHDVDFTFNRIIYNHEIPASSRPSFHFRFLDDESGEWEEAPMTVTAVDDFTVECVLPVPFAPFLRSMGTAIYPKHILEKHVDDGTFVETWEIDTDPAEVIGTGPFTIESYEPGERVVMRRSPNYWLKDAKNNRLPYLEEIVQIIVPDLEAELAKFLAGESDAHGVLGEELAELEPLQEDGNFTIYKRGPAFGTTFLGFNMNPGKSEETGDPYLAPEKLRWFQNTKFRQAVAHGIDKKAIIDDVQHGQGYPQWSSISPAAGDFHNPSVRRYEYDLQKANEILDGIGWKDTDGDGVREDGDGNAIEFSMVTNSGNSVRERVGEIVEKGMKEIGIGVSYELVDFGVLVSQLTATYDWEAMIIGFTGGTEPHGGINFWHSGENLHLWHPNQSEPATDWEAEIDRLYIEGSQELDRSKRVGIYHRAQEIAAENVPVIYTTLPERLTAIRNVFGNTTPTLYAIWDVRFVYRTDR